MSHRLPHWCKFPDKHHSPFKGFKIYAHDGLIFLSKLIIFIHNWSILNPIPYRKIQHQQHTSYSCHIFDTSMALRNLLDKHLYPVLLRKYSVLGEGLTPNQLSFIGFQFSASANQKILSYSKRKTTQN